MILKMEEIPFRRIPHLSDLYLGYVGLSPKALSFYRHPPALDEVEKAARDISARTTFPRREMAAILKRQHARLGGDDRNLQSIWELEQDDSVAVVTGQQVGLFAGPLYTIYKTLTALRLTAELRRREIRAIPIFWMDSEDHDLVEVTHITVLPANRSAAVIDFRNLLFGESRPEERPVGSTRLPEGIAAVLKEFASSLPDAGFKNDVQSWLERAYEPGTSFADAFGQLMLHLFGNTGLVIFDPQDPEAKRLLRPLFHRSIQSSGEIYKALLERNAALEKSGFVPQVSVLEDSTLLFVADAGRRRALTKPDNRFALKHTERLFTEEDLLNMAEDSPELFSPNVLLRPLAQDLLFPTAAYVAGPAEVAYFAQAETLYRIFERPMPVIWPRAGVTLVESEISLAMDKYEIRLEDLFQGRQHLVEKAVQASDHSKAGIVLNALEQDLAQNLAELRPVVAAIDASLDHAAETTKRKILHHVEAIRGRFARFQASQNTELLRTVDRILDSCYPNKNLQEREFSVHPFLTRYGLPLLDAIGNLLNPEDFAHHVVHLK